MIIDFHTHIFPDKIAKPTIEFLEGRANLVANTDGTLDGLKHSMAEVGVDISVVLPIVTKVTQANSINNFASVVNKEDHIISFGSIHPEQTDWKEELDRIVSLGLKGIKLHPDYQSFFVDDPKYLPIFKYMAELGLIVVLHAGVDIGIPDPVHCMPKASSYLLEQVPDLKLVLAHTGGWRCWDDVEKYLVGKNVYFDISFTMNTISRAQFLRIINNHPEDKLLFATDSPWGNQKEDIDRLKYFNLTNAQLENIYSKNALKLLNL